MLPIHAPSRRKLLRLASAVVGERSPRDVDVDTSALHDDATRVA